MRSEATTCLVQVMRTSDSCGAMKASERDELQDEARLAKIPDEGLQGLI